MLRMNRLGGLTFCLLVYRQRGDTEALAEAAKIGRFRW